MSIRYKLCNPGKPAKPQKQVTSFLVVVACLRVTARLLRAQYQHQRIYLPRRDLALKGIGPHGRAQTRRGHQLRLAKANKREVLGDQKEELCVVGDHIAGYFNEQKVIVVLF